MIVPPKYCSQKCNAASKTLNKKGPTPNAFFNCLACGKEVSTYRSPSAQQAYETKYCSLQCLGSQRTGEQNPAWSGGRHSLSNGYITVLATEHPNVDVRGYVYEHRLVMEQMLGRYLEPIEVVHHINGDVTDNRPENLMVFASQSEHSKHHAQERKNGKR